MITDILDALRDLSSLSDLRSGGMRWRGRTRRVRIGIVVLRLTRWLCLALGILGLVLLDPDAPRRAVIILAGAAGILVLTYVIEFMLIGRGLLVPDPADGSSRRAGPR